MTAEQVGLALVLVLAAGLRLPGLFQDLPFSFYGDELHFVERSMALGTGDLNPHWFHKPAFLMYILTFFYGLHYVIGAWLGRFESVDAFGAYFLADQGNFILIGRVVVAAFAVATVYMVYKIGRRVFDKEVHGLTAALVLAVLPAAVAASQSVKADVPAGFFVAWAAYSFLGTRATSRLRPLLIASALAGVAMGTKYYGIILIPVFLLFEFARRYTIGATWCIITWQ